MENIKLCGESLGLSALLLLISVLIFTWNFTILHQYYKDEKTYKNPGWQYRRGVIVLKLISLALGLILICLVPLFLIEPPKYI